MDYFVDAEGIKDIVFLKHHTDSDYFGPDVIDGTKITLEKGKADILASEYHGLCSVVGDIPPIPLKMYGYACHLHDIPTLWQWH